jgi:hypothetical protein
MAKREKDLEINLEIIEAQKLEEKKMRVKINQFENELELQLKRLTIVCKTKGLPKPKRPDCLPETPARRSGNYVSPYRVGVSPGTKSNQSKGSAH